MTGQVMLHPDLATPVCEECLKEYKQVDWAWKLMTSKTPGKEGACRWCTKTGKMVSCTECPKSFCKKCLKSNLGPNYIKLAETGSWTCLVCDSRPLHKVRAQLWADGEEAKKPPVDGGVAKSQSMTMNTRPGAVVRGPGQPPALRGSPSTLPRSVGNMRQPRPGTPRGMLPRPRIGTPRGTIMPGGSRGGTPFPLRHPAPSPRQLGRSNVTIEKVAKPPPPPQQARSGQAEAIIHQLQRYRY